MARTTESLVKGILNKDYGKLPDGSFPSLVPYIDSASSVIDDVVQCTVDFGDTALTTAKLELMERWLAAHFYTKMDPTYSQRTTGKGSGSMIRNEKEQEPYRDGAIMLDPTGCLKSILTANIARGGWLGLPSDSQLTARERGYNS